MPAIKKNGTVKHFPYTKAGREAAKRYAASGGKKVSSNSKKKRGYQMVMSYNTSSPKVSIGGAVGSHAPKPIDGLPSLPNATLCLNDDGIDLEVKTEDNGNVVISVTITDDSKFSAARNFLNDYFDMRITDGN